MADIAEDLKAFLQTVTGDSQVYYDRAPQSAQLPYVVITESDGGEDVETLGGYVGVIGSVWHVYAYHVTRVAANDLQSAIRKQLLALSSELMGSTPIHNVTTEQFRDTDVDEPQDKSYAVRYWTRKVYTLFYSTERIGV